MGCDTQRGAIARSPRSRDSEPGKRGREIVGMDVGERFRMPVASHASEWLTRSQCWLGAKLMKGPMKDAMAAGINLEEPGSTWRRICRAPARIST